MLRLLLLFAFLFSLSWAQKLPSLLQLLNSTTDASNFTALLNSHPAVAKELASLSDITLLVPSNDAITGDADGLTDPDYLKALLSYHVLNGTYVEFPGDGNVVTLLSSIDYTNRTGGQQVRSFTNAGAPLLISGYFEETSVLSGPLNFTGGTVFIIDSVLSIPADFWDTTTPLGLNAALAVANATGIIDTWQGITDVALFVPLNSGWEAIGSAIPNWTEDQAWNILSYHVVNGTTKLLSDHSVINYPTLQGGNLKVTVNATTGLRFVNNARVVFADIPIVNGVMHVIDQVLNPSQVTQSARPQMTAGRPAFPGASSAKLDALTSDHPPAISTIDLYALVSATGTSPSASATPSDSSSTGNDGDSSGSGSHSHAGKIAGIVVGVVVGLALIGLIIWFCWRRGYRFGRVPDEDAHSHEPKTIQESPAAEETERPASSIVHGSPVVGGFYAEPGSSANENQVSELHGRGSSHLRASNPLASHQTAELPKALRIEPIAYELGPEQRSELEGSPQVRAHSPR